MNPDGSNKHGLLQNELSEADPAWSANGQRIAYEAWGSDVDVWVASADGTGQTDLTNDPSAPDLNPAWSPDGTRIAFWKQNFDGTGALWVMDDDGSNQVALTDDTSQNSWPAWSPDGRWIAFSSDRDGNLELYLIHPDGTGLRRLTTSSTSWEENPSWSPDGQWLAFDACSAPTYPCPGSANYEIFRMHRNGTGRQRLTDDASIDANPSWSPDGTQIVFRSDRAATGTEVWVMDADGSNPRQLTFAPFGGGVDPDWQPIP
jgi:TolB protein